MNKYLRCWKTLFALLVGPCHWLDCGNVSKTECAAFQELDFKSLNVLGALNYPGNTSWVRAASW